MKASPAVTDPPPPSLLNRRLWAVFGLILVAVVFLHFTPLERFRENLQDAKETLGGSGLKGPGLYLLFASIGISVGVSRLFFCFLGGVAFGFLQGFVLAMLAGLLGATMAFALFRWYGGHWAENLSGRLGRWRDRVKNPDTLSVILLRQIPVSGVVLNAGLAIGGTRWPPFLGGTLVGYLPQTLVFCLLGSGLGKDSILLASIQIGSSALFLIVFALLAGRMFLRRQAGRENREDS